jgi:hypothetical protein
MEQTNMAEPDPTIPAEISNKFRRKTTRLLDESVPGLAARDERTPTLPVQQVEANLGANRRRIENHDSPATEMNLGF